MNGMYSRDLTRTAKERATVLVMIVTSFIGQVDASDVEGPVVEATVDSVLALSADKALKLEMQIKRAYAKLSPSVVRMHIQNDDGNAFNAHGQPLIGGVSGVIIDQTGLILTCSHHDEAPGTRVTIELADGKRVAGKFLGRFKLDDPKPMHVGPDLGLARITESGKWPAATVGFSDPSAKGQVYLAIGYPGTLLPGRPPLLRIGRITPGFPGIPWLATTITIEPGDSGGPLFDMAGRVVGILSGADSVAPTLYESVSVLKKFRERLESGEIVSAATKVIRVIRARPARPAAFLPLPDLENRVLQMQSSVIRIMDGPHAIAAGLIVDSSGLAITKASLVGSRQEWSCRLFYVKKNKAIVKGRVIATSPEHDLALMKLDVRDWPVTPWSANRPVVGTIVSSVLGRSAGPLQFSVVGAEACDEPAKPNDIPQIALSVEPNKAKIPIIKQRQWETAEFDVYRELLQPGDVVTHLNGTPTPTTTVYGRVMDRLLYAVRAKTGDVNYSLSVTGSFHGDWVSIGIRRGAEKRLIRIPKVHSVPAGALNWHSNPLSLRREAFPMVFAHDGHLRPEQCGGPVVDLAGRVVGLNIARADNTRTLAIPADVLQKVVSQLRQQTEGAVQ